jgi:uncharacterized damage-inducible protein DinB
MHVVQWVYLQMWRAEPLNVPPEDRFEDLGDVLAWARPYYAEARSFLHHADENTLSHTLDIPWAEEVVKRFGTVGPVTLAESMLQVVLHTTYHRAQVATRIRELGGEPPLTDFVAWAWKDRPEARWRTGTSGTQP